MRERVESADEGRERVSRLYRTHGLVPSWDRVWLEGVDITHQPPSTWPWPYSDYVAGKRGTVIRQRYLREHAEAVAERGGLA
jgi:hypothetical protein